MLIDKTSDFVICRRILRVQQSMLIDQTSDFVVCRLTLRVQRSILFDYTSDFVVSDVLDGRQTLIIVTEEASRTLELLRAKTARTELPSLRDLPAILIQPLAEAERWRSLMIPIKN
jgi:hypothetical protein